MYKKILHRHRDVPDPELTEMAKLKLNYANIQAVLAGSLVSLFKSCHLLPSKLVVLVTGSAVM